MHNYSMATQEVGKKPGKKRVEHVRKILEDMDCDPFAGLAEICTRKIKGSKDYFYGPEIRIPCLNELAAYVAPKLRSMEVSVDPNGGNLGFQIIQFGEITDGNSARNNTQHIEGGGHGSVQLPVHVHSSDGSETGSDEKDHNPGSSGDGGIKPKSIDR